MKTIWIYFSKSGKMWYPFNINEYYESYQELINIIEQEKTVKVYIVRGNSYQWNWVFSEAYYFDNKKLNTIKTIKIDLIFNRCDLHKINDCEVINSPSFYELCEDKYKTFLRFPGISAATEYIHEYQDLEKSIKKLNINSDELVVLKKNFWMEWRDIHIVPANTISNNLYADWSNVLVQKFIDSSVGINKLVEWLHDLRVMIVNHTIIWATIRTPKQWCFLANVAQWGTSITLDIQLLPRELLDVLAIVMDHLDDYENIIYWADFMNSTDGYKLVELNACPWLLHKNWDKNCFNFYHAISKMLLSAIKKI